MGVAKPVHLRNGESFDKAGDAGDRFKAILNDGELRSDLVGEEHRSVDALFRDYCAATNWDMPGEPKRYFRDWNKAEDRTTKSFYVEYHGGETDDFSYVKAVRAVANWKR